MKPVLVALAAAAVAAVSPAAAQDAHAGHAAHAAAPAAAAEATKFSLDTPVEALVADVKAKAVLDATLPGLTTHESYEMFKGMTLNQLSGMAPDKLTPEALAKVATELAKVS